MLGKPTYPLGLHRAPRTQPKTTATPFLSPQHPGANTGYRPRAHPLSTRLHAEAGFSSGQECPHRPSPLTSASACVLFTGTWLSVSPQPAGCRRAGLCPGQCGELGTRLQFSRFLSPQVFGFFKGMSFPLASIAVYNSVVFGVFSNTQRFLSQHHSREPEAGPPHTLSDLLLASMVAGVVSVGLGTPVDLIKIRLQMQTQPFRESKRPGRGLVSGHL